MRRPLSRPFLIAVLLLPLAACDSGGDGDPPAADPALVTIAVQDADGRDVEGLQLSMEYELDGSEGEGRSPNWSPVRGEGGAAARFASSLRTGYPNPFDEFTILSYTTTEQGLVELEVLDLDGQPATAGQGDRPAGYLVRGERSAGTFALAWEPGASTPGGFYRVRLIAAGDTSSVLSVYRGTDGEREGGERLVVTRLGETDSAGLLATDERALFPQLYPGLETEARDFENTFLGTLRPSNDVTFVLRDDAGREQRYERAFEAVPQRFDLTWDPTRPVARAE